MLLLQALEEQTGSAESACALWKDLRNGLDAESSVTTTRSFATQSPPTLPDLCPLSGELAGQFPGAVMFDAGSFQAHEPLSHEPCGRPGQPECPEALGNVPALPGTGVVGGLLDTVGDLLGGILSLSFLDDDGANLAGHWATLTRQLGASGEDQTRLSEGQREQVLQRIAGIETGLNGLRDGFPSTMSNALLLNAEHSASGQPLAVFGPRPATLSRSYCWKCLSMVATSTPEA